MWRDPAGNQHEWGNSYEDRAEAEDMRVDLEDKPDVEATWIDEVAE
jgi:hypothetical protein